MQPYSLLLRHPAHMAQRPYYSSLPFQDLSTASSVYISCSHNSNLLVFVNSQTKGSTLDASFQNFKPCFLIRKETSKQGDKYYDKSLIYRGLI